MTENDFRIAEYWLREAMEFGEDEHNAPYEKAIQALEEVKAYRAIGTIEEFKALKEKNEPKKVDEEYCCPICHTCGMDDDGIAGAYCTECGQKLNWQ